MFGILVGDIGGTSADWALVTGAEVTFFKGTGFNPSSQSESRLEEICKDLSGSIPNSFSKLEVYYFGAGIHYPGASDQICSAFHQHLTIDKMKVASDLHGAAIALYGVRKGVVGILGTGSNICYYDGSQIIGDGKSLGYPLGDEGGGYDIGARFIRDFYYEVMPLEVREVLAVHLPGQAGEFVANLRTYPAPNQFLGAMVGKLGDLAHHNYVQEVVKKAFHNFCAHHLHRFESYHKINFVGSIAFYFCSELRQVLRAYDFELERVEKRPIEALAKFYQSQIV